MSLLLTLSTIPLDYIWNFFLIIFFFFVLFLNFFWNIEVRKINLFLVILTFFYFFFNQNLIFFNGNNYSHFFILSTFFDISNILLSAKQLFSNALSAFVLDSNFLLLLKNFWIFLLFKPTWDTFLILNYQFNEIFYFILNYSAVYTFEFFFLVISKLLPYLVDLYIIFLILVLVIFSCLGKKVALTEFITFKTIADSVLTSLKIYFYIIASQYVLFCYDIKVGPVYFSNSNNIIFGQFDNWVIVIKFIFILFFFLFFVLLENLFLFTKNYILSYEILIFLLISFELLLIILSASNLLILVAAICGVSIATYVLIAFDKTYISAEASIKYFCLSAIATGFMIFGYILLIHLDISSSFSIFSLNNYSLLLSNNSNDLTGYFSTDLLNFTNFFNSNLQSTIAANKFLYFYLYEVGFLFFLSGFLFKLSLFPFYIWAPDVYDGSSFLVVGFLIIVVKFVIFLSLMRIIFTFHIFNFFFLSIFKIVGFFSIIIGSLGAMTQQKIKRFVAFTSVNQIGLMLLGVAFDYNTIFGSLFMLMVYVVTNLIFFGVILNTYEIKSQRTFVYMSDLHNFFISSPIGAIYLTISILSMAGIPPFLGFFSKYFLILPILNSIDGLIWGFFVLVFHVVGVFNYLRFVRDIWFHDLSKVLIFYTNINTNFVKFTLLALSFTQVFGFFFLEHIYLFCNYLKWSLLTTDWL